ncbi:DNA-binding SARP family transcriptional activator [Paucibacter oligotrophus]|uniref:DNA-binding SARP family transcriptional activator n=1 Tax=Roseateles oligotrophus TaxID=1769250 RepID=A0A840LH30_9BURK|nr:AAA family ATPase [Roseateles oligotrophus]MBB4845922.1 DNA-binding SARP family transcriptional activator [Roseateles oligotrophus]
MPAQSPTAAAPDTPHARPRLRLLGGFELCNAQGEPQALPYDKARALLAMLALQTGPLQREGLAETLWPDSALPQARANLRRALFDLRRCLDGLGLQPSLPADKKQVQLLHEGLSLDCQDFAQAQLDATSPQREARRQALQQCQSLYRGPLLAGLALSEAPGFEQWLAPRREALQRQALRSLQALAQLQEEDGDSAAALASAHQCLALDPWCEAALRRCMHLAGPAQTGEALALFERFRARLHGELKAQPQEETQALARQLRQAQAGPAEPPLPARPERRRVVALACEWGLIEALQAQAEESLASEQIARQMQRQLSQARELLLAQGAHVQRAEGGELLAFFGHPQALEQAPRLALSAAWQLLRLPREPCLDLRLGLHAGWVHAAPEQASPDGVGAISRQARRLALLADAGRAQVSAELCQQSERHHRFEPAAPDGSAALLSSGPGGRAELLRQLLPMVGREAELAALLQQWAEAEGQARAVWLQGEPGLGKTRLLQALRQAAHAAAPALQGPRVLQLQCRPETLHSPLQPIVALLRRSLPADCSEAQAEQGLQALLQQAGLDSPHHRALLSQLLQPQSTQSPPLIEPLHKRQLLGLLSTLFERMAQGQRQLLILEDLHWADPSTLELLALHLARASAQALPGLLLLSSRLAPPAELRPQLSLQLQLHSLPAAQMAQLIAQLAHAPSGAEPRREILQRADGVPLFAEELARSWHLAQGRAGGEQIPATLWDLLAARLDQLPPLAKHLAQGAALLGSGWEPELLQALLGLSAAQLDQGLSQLQHAGLLQLSVSGVWQFRHALLREAALETLAPAERRALHRRAADALMDRYAARAAEAPEALARHLHAAQDPAAAHYWLQAAERAAAQSAQVEARHLFEQGLVALQWPAAANANANADPALAERLRAPLLLGLGHCLLTLQGYGSAAARSCYAQALDACLQAPERGRGLRFQAMWGLWLGSRSGPGEASALDLAAELGRVAAQDHDAAAAVQASYALGNNLFFAGQLAAASQALREAAEAGQRLAPTLLTGRYGEHGGITARTLLSWPLALTGQAEAAQAQAREGLAQARALGHVQTLGFSLAIVAVLQRHLRELGAAETYARELAELSERHGMALWRVVADLVLGWTQCQRGEPAGLGLIEAACAASAVAMPSTEATFLSFLIEAQLQLGLAEPALQNIVRALAMAQQRQEFYLLPELWRMRALGLQLSRVEDAAVRASLAQALAHAEAFGAELLRQRCLSQQAAFEDSMRIQR